MLSLSSLFEIKYSQLPEIIVFSEVYTNRLNYAADFIFNRVLGKSYILTSDIETFISSDKIKINYSQTYFENAINVYPIGLITSKGIDKNFFPNFSVNQHNYYSEDIFSKVFYFISRYEEWQKNFTKDTHGRFEWEASAVKEQLHQPLVDIGIRNFEQYIQKKYPVFETNYFYKEILTFDLDNILAFKGKSWVRSIGATFKHILKSEYDLLTHRIKVLLKKSPDPFEEVYEFIRELSAYHPIIFFVLCRSNTKFDRAADIRHFQTQHILNTLKTFAHIGLHPSYYSMKEPLLIEKEKKLLEQTIGETIISSRQHYLRTEISDTPFILMKNGIQYDFTMGFASHTGFRMGTSYPVNYYDFNTEQAADLLLIPFCVMDGAYFNYHQISVEQAIEDIQRIRQTIKHTGGYFIPLFHEITLSDWFNKDAKKWRDVFFNPQ